MNQTLQTARSQKVGRRRQFSIAYYFDLILTLTQKEVKVRYKNNVLGYLWSIANPVHERRIGAANRRFLSALRALAAVRRMRFPDMLAIVNVEAGTRLAGARVGG